MSGTNNQNTDATSRPGPVRNTTLPFTDALRSSVPLLDTSFAMQEAFTDFIARYRPTLAQHRVLVPYRVLQEIEQVAARNDGRTHLAVRAAEQLKQAVADGLAEFRRDSQDDAVICDAVLSRVVEQVLPTKDVMVLTHDRDLVDYLYTKKNAKCFSTKRLVIVGLRRDGRLFAWRQNSGGDPCHQGQARRTGNAAPAVPPFRMGVPLATSADTPLLANETLSSGSLLRLKDGRTCRLGEPLATGGEGTVFRTDSPDLLCKLYHQSKLTTGKRDKIELMITRRLTDSHICWPLASVHDTKGVFRGFIMPKAKTTARPLGHTLFVPSVFLKSSPAWTRRESCTLAINILQRIKVLHDANVLIGDINPMNILICDDQSAYLVDCDSYQVEGYPCPVGTVTFTAPEIQSTDFRHVLRTKEHDLFAVATLLFMIFMPGKAPYSHQGGEDGASNITKMHFPYALGERKSNAAPAGPWRFCWSHLSKPMKVAFNACFHEDHRGRPRPSIDEWLSLCTRYRTVLYDDTKTFRGPDQKIGIDLSLLPDNIQRAEIDGVVQPPWSPNGITDKERMLRAVTSEASRMRPRSATPSHAPHGYSNRWAATSTQQATRPPTHHTQGTAPPPPPASTPKPQSTMAGVGTVVTGLIGLAIGGPVGLIVGGIIGYNVGKKIK